MRVKLLALVFVVTVLALTSQPAAQASVFCPAYTCYQALQNCLNGGGAPWSEVSINETCYTLPSSGDHDVDILTCYYDSTDSFQYQECYR
jgi:hypothetical protein